VTDHLDQRVACRRHSFRAGVSDLRATHQLHPEGDAKACRDKHGGLCSLATESSASRADRLVWPRSICKALFAYRAECRHTGDDDLVFTARHAKPRGPLTPNAVAAWFKDLYARRLGWTGYGSHSGRRTFATQAARKATPVGASLRDVQDILGHANLNTTQRYLEPSSDAKWRLVDLV
jgi:integrase